MPYVPPGDPSLPRKTREPLDEYPYLRELGYDWLDRYDEAALDEVDTFVTAHDDGIDAEPAGHDIAVYLCNWVVANSEAAQWVLDPRAGTCYVEVRGSGHLLDPYRHVVTCLTDRMPVAHRFAEQAQKLGA